MKPNLERIVRTLLLTIGLLLLLMVCLAALPAAVRALPGRYAYYLPEPLQDLRHVPHPDTLPTPRMWPTIAVATFTPVPSPTPLPATPTPLPAIEALPTPTPVPTLPARAILTGLRHEPQRWNNCGPATLAMLLSFWGRTETQLDIAPALKPDPEDKNVGPEEMADYVRGLGLQATLRFGGDLDLVKRLIAHRFPVIVETWMVRDARDQLGHYRLIVGYDDDTRQFLTYDSLHGPDLPVDYEELDELWRVFNRLYLVVTAPERAADLEAVLGPAADPRWADERALETAQAEAQNPPAACVAYAACPDAATFAWFNAGTSLAALDRFEEAAAAYDRARVLGLPWRMLWYQFGPYAAYDAVGRYADVIALADETLRVTANLEESYYWRGRARLAQGDADGARADFEAALHYHPDWPPALDALAALSDAP